MPRNSFEWQVNVTLSLRWQVYGYQGEQVNFEVSIHSRPANDDLAAYVRQLKSATCLCTFVSATTFVAMRFSRQVLRAWVPVYGTVEGATPEAGELATSTPWSLGHSAWVRRSSA